jgi:RNA polymerase sigma factor (sigma-70 family)
VTATWEDQLRELVHARGQALVRYAFVLCGDQSRAEDLVQTAITRTFARRGALDEPEAYVRRAILTGYLDEQRRTGLFRRRRGLLATPAAYEITTDVEQHHDVMALLAVLSPQQRACVTLRYLCDQTVDEVARTLNCSTGNVKRHLHDAVVRLRAEHSASEEEHEHG